MALKFLETLGQSGTSEGDTEPTAPVSEVTISSEVLNFLDSSVVEMWDPVETANRRDFVGEDYETLSAQKQSFIETINSDPLMNPEKKAQIEAAIAKLDLIMQRRVAAHAS